MFIFSRRSPPWLALILTAVLCAFVLLESTVAIAGKAVFVNTRYAKLRAGKTSSAPEVARLAFGQQLNVVAEEATFLQVTTTTGQSGWVARQWVNDKAPGKSGLAESLGAAARGDGGSGVAYTAGARGLAPEAESYAATKGDMSVAIADVKEMERFNLGEAKVESCLRDGKLGEFADLRSARGVRPQRNPETCAIAGRPICLLRGIR